MIDNVQSSNKMCSIVGCGKEKHAKMLCHNHYRELIRRASGVKAQAVRPDKCVVKDCNKKHYSMDYCASHYARLKSAAGIQEELPIKALIYGKENCDVPFCKNKHKAKGLCATHDATKRNYSLTSEQLVEMLSRLCEVCGAADNLTIDHDHSCCNSRTSCGKCVRGTICQHCNRSMGQAKDNIQILRSLADYLERYSSNNGL
jgi:hypothetical protein